MASNPPATRKMKVVCVFGSYDSNKGQALYEQAYALGRALAEAGYTLANGGYGGTMEAGARGAKDAGGRTIGVTCQRFAGRGKRRPRANRWIDEEIRRDDPLERIRTMIELSSAYVALPGGTGTLTELAVAWEYVCKRLIQPRPIFLLGEFWRPVAEPILALRPREGRHLHFVDEPAQIIAALNAPAVGTPADSR